MSGMSTPLKVVAVLTTILLLIVVNPFFQIPDDQAQLRDILTYAFWISFIVLLVMLFMLRDQPGGEEIEVEGPAFTRFLFNNTRAGLFWLPVRLFLGLSWLDAGWHKLQDPAWVGADAGTALAFGSDAPVETADPLAGIYAAATRRRPGGRPADGWYPQERIGVDDAVRAYTAGAAYAAGVEARVGRLAPGLRADFVALSEDIMRAPAAAIPSARVTLTVFDGEVVYQA